MRSRAVHARGAPPRRPTGAPPPRGARESKLVHVTTAPFTLTFMSGQAATLRGEGLAVHAISSPGPHLARFAEDEQVTVHPVEMARQIAPLRDLASLWRLWRKLRELRPVIVDAHTPKAGLLGMLAATLAATPVRVYHMHGLRFLTANGWRRQLLRLTERAACALSDEVLAVSPSVRAIAVEEGICPAERIKVLLGGSVNGVDATDRFRPRPASVRAAARRERGIPDDALVVGFVGRLARDKGIVELASAWRRLREDPRLHLLLVGVVDTTDAPPPGVVAGLRADPRVHLTEWELDTPRLYSAMDVVALPTYREGFPQVALEAAAMALPLVTTSVSGSVDAVRDGVTGTLVPARDVARLAEALERYLSDASLRERHGAAARRRVLSEFRREAVREALVAEYRRLLLAGGRGEAGSSA